MRAAGVTPVPDSQIPVLLVEPLQDVMDQNPRIYGSSTT